MAISKRLRFEILKRDGYRCRYCGVTADEVKLVVDAVVPEALGGSHKDPANLRAACEPCNNGKTSSNPDAPLVADVAEDALRWSRAMATAAEQMRADTSREDGYLERFDDWWAAELGKDCPRPDDWDKSVRTWLRVGLPIDLLEQCVTIATHARAGYYQKWRYMCGVAWGKVSDLQKAAGRTVGRERGGDGALAGQEGDYDRGRLELAQELLATLPDEERAHFLDEADMSEYRDEDEPPQTMTEIATEAIQYALGSLHFDVDYLLESARQMLSGLPGDMGERALKAADPEERSRLSSPLGNKVFYMARVLWCLRNLINLPAATEYLDAMPKDQRAEWIAYAIALNAPSELTEVQQVLYAAECARVITEEDRFYPAMCRAKGKHIPACPHRGKYNVWVNELECCAELDHPGHVTCEQHLESMVDTSKPFTVKDFTDLPAESEKAPF